jgi:hypothetical protein
MIEEPNGGFNGREYYANHVLLLDALSEGYSEQLIPDFDAQKFLSVLKTTLDEDPKSSEYQAAYNIVWRILTRSSVQFIHRAKGLALYPQLGVLLDQKENENLDVGSGTFFDLLRYGSVHFEQRRDKINLYAAEKPEAIIRKRVLEA